MPVDLKNELIHTCYSDIVKNLKIMNYDKNFTSQLITNLYCMRLNENDILYRQNDPSEESFF